MCAVYRDFGGLEKSGHEDVLSMEVRRNMGGDRGAGKTSGTRRASGCTRPLIYHGSTEGTEEQLFCFLREFFRVFRVSVVMTIDKRDPICAV